MVAKDSSQIKLRINVILPLEVGNIAIKIYKPGGSRLNSGIHKKLLLEFTGASIYPRLTGLWSDAETMNVTKKLGKNNHTDVLLLNGTMLHVISIQKVPFSINTSIYTPYILQSK